MLKAPLSGLILLATFNSYSAQTASTPPIPSNWQPAESMNTQTQSAPTAQTSTIQQVPVQSTAHPEPNAPLPSPALSYALDQVAPLTPEDVSELHQTFDQLQRSESRTPITAVPRISSLTVNLSPGASLPLLRALPNFPSTVSFTDETGAPWNIGAPPINGNEAGFEIKYIPNSPVMSVQAKRAYDTASVSVYLQGLPVPIVISLSSGEAGNSNKAQITDSRLDLRIPLRGPAAKQLPITREKISLEDPLIQAFLDGVPPKEAKRLKTSGDVPMTSVWQMGDDLYIRSRHMIRDSFVATSSSADGTRIWKLPVTPEAVFSVQGRNATLNINLE
ncbi:Dot/Icm type IV secretion system outer membrane subcomplex protein IcmK/DotH [Xenorhabdus mauleonii]|uniref:Dot/Icm type IV secretion system outer membrane subcomplex protein IcmK/DotH n=1 Tax=Xenorhabdus mauleonii TaxID=351675 RepID=A0A1I3V5L0_9GAMM|nr:DotH/IcmK family type IV secretion protein [Xenorhabdus mauleonii]PHM37627.1 Dot/Icm type IV secretion system outer membrane subcomplex protein IcmK/DotH [Xenorhabdus mauleonii]SFJ90203.1 intracellular multiplication protein IcmK [Xenorhabdus mauleonii]